MSIPDGSNDRPVDAPSHAGPSMVVGLGASAGGIKVLGEFFSNVPPDTGMAYVVVLHLSPDHDSKLAEVLQSSSAMPISQVRESVRLQRDRVYVIPPNQALEVVDGQLQARPLISSDDRRAPVDLFFRTLADAYAAHAAAVVLSGTGPNGSNGIRRIKEHGGLTIAQDPTEAEYSDMPRNSIATGLVDYVLPVARIPAQIRAYHQRLLAKAAQQSVPSPPDGELDLAIVGTPAGSYSHEWHEILSLLRVRTGHDFSSYKPGTLRRRVERRLAMRGLATVTDYVEALRTQPDEATSLMKELLISVTNFFRDRHAFEALEHRVIPAICRNAGSSDQVRVWCAGCATGEEAYSVAMLLLEYVATMLDAPPIQIFATDLDHAAIDVGREGFYTDADVVDVSAARLQRFFLREPGGYRVRRALREVVLFAHHNVIKDPPFSHLDLVTCRNVLIYLNRPMQDRLLETLHFALKPSGYLFLGTAESADGSELFQYLDREAHIFESRAVSSRLPLSISDRPLAVGTALSLPRPEWRASAERTLPGDLHLRLLEQFAPPSIIVNDEHMLVHVSASAARFLQMPAGEPTRDILKLIDPRLRSDLRTALYLAMQQNGPVEVDGIVVADDVPRLRIVVRPALRDEQRPRGYFVVTFEEETEARPPQPVQLTSPFDASTQRLEEDLTRVKSQLRVTIEQHETHSEEARAANEELHAMNEELRSSAEELETSKEELQSVNEELTTVNQELKIKIEELGLTHNDFQNLINSTDIGTIFLDRALRVKLSTPAAQRIFNLLPSDVGRPLADITSRLVEDHLHSDVALVLERLQTVEREVQSRDGRNYLMRILPYRTIDDRIDGVSITFHDVTKWREAESRVRASEERLRLLIETAIDYAIFTLTEDGLVDSWNPGAERMFGYATEEIIGREVAVLFTPEDRAADVPAQELGTARRTGRASDERWHVRKDGTQLFCSGVTTRLGEGLGFAKIARDLTGRREADQELERAHSQLETRVAQRTVELRAEVRSHAEAEQRVTALLRRLVTSQEDQSARIARDLHDQLGQQLTALRMALERVRDEPAPRDEIDRALQMTRDIDRQVDFLAWELRPAALDDLGLTVALPQFVHEWAAHVGLQAQIQTTGTVAGRLSRDAESTFYRVAQEALHNVAKHAHASRVDVVLEGRDDAVVLVIEDDGIGFDPTHEARQTGVGLVGMRERAALVGATLQVESSPGNGTTVFLRSPAAPSAKPAR